MLLFLCTSTNFLFFEVTRCTGETQLSVQRRERRESSHAHELERDGQVACDDDDDDDDDYYIDFTKVLLIHIF